MVQWYLHWGIIKETAFDVHQAQQFMKLLCTLGCTTFKIGIENKNIWQHIHMLHVAIMDSRNLHVSMLLWEIT